MKLVVKCRGDTFSSGTSIGQDKELKEIHLFMSGRHAFLFVRDPNPQHALDSIAGLNGHIQEITIDLSNLGNNVTPWDVESFKTIYSAFCRIHHLRLTIISPNGNPPN